MSAAPDQSPEAEGLDIHTTAGKLADLDRRLDEAVHAGSAKAVEKQHAKGRKTARERIAMLFDEGSFVELDELARHRSTAFGLEKTRPYGDGVVTGYGTIDGRQARSSASTRAPAPASRRAWSPSVSTARSSAATSTPRA